MLVDKWRDLLNVDDGNGVTAGYHEQRDGGAGRHVRRGRNQPFHQRFRRAQFAQMPENTADDRTMHADL